MAQVFRLDRTVTSGRSGGVRKETVYGLTSLSPARGSADQLLASVRGPWPIENHSHWVRDVTFDEDRSQVRVGSIPQIMAALRNTSIGLRRASGDCTIAAATRRLAARPWDALALLGITPEHYMTLGTPPSYGRLRPCAATVLQTTPSARRRAIACSSRPSDSRRMSSVLDPSAGPR